MAVAHEYGAQGGTSRPVALGAQDLVVQRRHRRVLDGVSLTLAAGEVLGILGANGAGKSTLLAALTGELKPKHGTVWLGEVPLERLSAQEQARCQAVLPQKPSLQFDLEVAEVVAMGAYPYPELPASEVAQGVEEALGLADLVHLRDRAYLALSGGEQQRVQFARVVLQARAGRRVRPGPAAGTGVLMLDEPTASLDPKHQQSLMKVVQQLAHGEGMAVAVVLHDLNLASRWCDRLLLLHRGQVRACGRPCEVLTVEALLDAYDVHPTVAAGAIDPVRPRVWFD